MSDFQSTLQLLGVQVGRLQPLDLGDRSVMSGIRKQAVQGNVAVEALGPSGDEQADLSVHGGISKAVYAYPVEHYEFWRDQKRALGLSTDLPYGSFGENLTLTGLLEDSLYVGDTLMFPDCILRVTQPRGPCYKLNAFMEDPKSAQKMARSGYSGFYLAVEMPGSIATGQSFEVVAGQRETPLMDLFGPARARSR